MFYEKREPATLLKKRLWHRCFPVNFEKFVIIIVIVSFAADILSSLIIVTEHALATASGSLTMIKDDKISAAKETISM